MELIKKEDLVIGNIYRDTPEKYEFSTYLKFVGYEGADRALFEYVGGHDTYIKSDDGHTLFGRNSIFYEPNPEELASL